MLDALVGQMARHQLDRAPGADQQGMQAAKVGEYLLRQSHGSIRHGNGILANGRIRAHLFRNGEGFLKGAPEGAAHHAHLFRYRIGRLDLTQNLRFAQHHGVKPAGHAHQVPDNIFPPVKISAALYFGAVQSVILAEPVQQPQFLFAQRGIIQRALRIGHGRFSHIYLGVKFGAIAGGNDDQFVQGRQRCRALYRIRHFLRRKCNPLTKVDVRGVVIDTE